MVVDLQLERVMAIAVNKMSFSPSCGFLLFFPHLDVFKSRKHFVSASKNKIFFNIFITSLLGSVRYSVLLCFSLLEFKIRSQNQQSNQLYISEKEDLNLFDILYATAVVKFCPWIIKDTSTLLAHTDISPYISHVYFSGIGRKFSDLQQQYEEVIKDRDKLRQDYEEIVLLREQEKLETTKESRSPTPSKSHGKSSTTSLSQQQEEHFSISNKTFDVLQKENDDLTYKIGDLRIEHDVLLSNYKKLQEDNLKLRKENDQLVKTGNDYDAMKQRCALALMGFETALRDREEMRQQHDLLGIKLEDAKKMSLKMSRDITELQKEKDSAVHEYRLVMSERESVHQEIAKLQDDLGQTKSKELELHKEKEKAFLEKENFQKKVKSLSISRDKALSELQEQRSRFNKERLQYIEQIKQQRQELEMLEQQRNAAKKERSEAMVHRDEILKECFEVKKQCTRIQAGETEDTKMLKEQFNKLCFELKAWKTQELSNQIWAFNERDKVIRERDKVIRELEMRKEDYMKLEEELRQYKEIAKGTPTSRLHKTYLLSKENMLPSQDSAIDTDSLVSARMNSDLDHSDFKSQSKQSKNEVNYFFSLF